MIEAPTEVHDVAEKLTGFWIEFGRRIMDRLQLFHGGTGAFFYRIWCPGIWMQDDAATLLSSNLHEEFTYCNYRIAHAFDHTVMHQYLANFMPVDYLLESSVDVIEIHVDVGGPTSENLCETYSKVLAQNPLIIRGYLTEELHQNDYPWVERFD